MKSEKIEDTGENKPAGGGRRVWLKIILPLLILTLGIAGAVYLERTGPEAPRKSPEKQVPLVQTTVVSRSDRRVSSPAMGTVIPSRELLLKSRVSGEIVFAHPEFVEGGMIRKGEVILQIDPADYALIVTQKQMGVTQARTELQLELGRQDVAAREWKMLNADAEADPSDEALALRKPHLEKARADLKAAEADLEKALLDLDRTRITAPFDAVVRSRNVEMGSQTTAGESLATLAGTDAYWIQAAIAISRLKWIQAPRKAGQTGSRVRVVYSEGRERRGTVIRMLSDLQTDGRLARLLIEVPDPLNIRSASANLPPLLIGEYVRLEIEGIEIADVFEIPRSALRDGSRIWVVNADSILEIRPVEPLWSDEKSIYLDQGLSDGEHLVVSDLAVPVDGMELRIEKSVQESPAQTSSTQNSHQP